MSAISSPCISVCAVDGTTGLCVGCGRTLKEIAAWSALSEAERLHVMAELPARLASASCGPGEASGAPRDRAGIPPF